MADVKKYYYMRLKENFFDSEEMVVLESMPDGMLYSNILIKMYLKSLKANGMLMFKDTIPYNPTMIATITRHQVGTVEKALRLFEELGLIEVLDNGAIYMNDIELFIGKTSTEGERKKAARLRIQQEKEQKLIGVGQVSDVCPPEKEIDIEIEKELNIKPSRQKFETSDMDNAKLLFKMMQDNNPNVKEPKLEKWANEFRLMRERDGRTDNHIKYMIDWCQKDSFWYKNILSPDKLRKQWDRLVLAAKDDYEKKQKKSYQQPQTFRFSEVAHEQTKIDKWGIEG